MIPIYFSHIRPTMTMKRGRVPPSAAAAVVAFALGSIGPASSFHVVTLPQSSECGSANSAHHVSRPSPSALAVTHPRGTKNTALNLFRNRRGSSSVEKDNDLATDETESMASSSENRRGDDNNDDSNDDENTDRRRRSSKQRAEGKTKKLSPRQLRKLANHPLHQAGQTFVAASVQSMGMLFYNVGGMEHKEIQQELLAAGTHLVSAAKAWDSDWRAARDSLRNASDVFVDISDTFGSAQIDDAESLATLFESIGLELEDASRIERRRRTTDNLLAVRDHLASVAEILDENAVAESDDHDMITSFYAASDGFGKLAKRYS